MRLRNQLQIVGISLVLLPALGLSLIYGSMLSNNAAASARELASVKLGLLENRLYSAYDILAKAGLADSEFYLGSYRASAAARYAASLRPGEGFVIVSPEGGLLDGARRPVDGEGPRAILPAPVTASDPLVRLMAAGEGRGKETIAALGPGADFLAWKRFEPLGWTIVVGLKEQLALEPLGRALLFSTTLSLLLFALASFLMIRYSRQVGDPLARLALAVEGMGEGKHPLKEGLASSFGTARVDEVRDLAREIDRMARKLGALTEGLETRVEARTEELSRANASLIALNADLALSLDRQEKLRGVLVQSEKLAALGQLVAGIAHELNTPLAAIDSASWALRDAYASFERLVAEMEDMAPELRQAVFTLASKLSRIDTQDRKARSRLRIKLAEELRGRSIADAEGQAALLAESCLEVDDLPRDIRGEAGAKAIAMAIELSTTPRSVSIVTEATKRASRVIEALRIYARQSKEEEHLVLDLASNLDGILPLFASSLTRAVEITKHYEARPLVLGQADKLAQVWTNIISNALQAMNYQGSLDLGIAVRDSRAIVSIRDTGPGIPDGIRASVFTPFFTTKPAGEGTGLGLDISRRIVEEHEGRISFESSPEGTTFLVELPIHGEAPPAAEAERPTKET